MRLLSVFLLTIALANAAERPPNVVLIFTDDQGYGDVGAYGAKGFATPHIDRLAREGIRLTDFYVAQAVCSASRAALLTGCYPNRVGILGALGPRSKTGIHERETLLPEIFKQRGYATAMIGKWHLGDHPKFLPTRHGFDNYYGLPYSNDMWPMRGPKANYPTLPMIQDGQVFDQEVTAADQMRIIQDYTERAVHCIESNNQRPFFLYLAHNLPHVPLFGSERFRGRTEQGRYGDVIEEIDWSVGQVLEALRRNDLERNTLVIFTTDNGPWLSYGQHAGSAGPLREGKGTAWDGGVRVPFLARWPGRIPAGAVCREPAMTIDLLPTLAKLIGATPGEFPIDGKNIWPLLAQEANARSPQEAYYFFWGDELHAVRAGRWKLHFPHAYRSLRGEGGHAGEPAAYLQRQTGWELYDLNDPRELFDVAGQHPAEVVRLRQLGEAFVAKLNASKRAPAQLSDAEFRARWPQ